MIIFIILLVLFVGGLFLLFSDINDTDILGCILSLFTGIWLIIHTCIWINTSYEFNSWVKQRNSFELTLKQARENNRELEAAAILKDVVEWNRQLAQYKYENTLFIYDWCIDDRIDTLKPIK